MTVLAIGTGAAILAWIGLALGLVVLVVVFMLFWRVLRPAQEIRRYADTIAAAVEGIERNVGAAEELDRTRMLASSLPDRAEAYLRRRREGAA